MQAVEALERLISEADAQLSLNTSRFTDAPELSDHEKSLETAASICQAMLNTALPIARFRAHVSIEEGDVKSEFTICAVTIAGVKASLSGLKRSALTIVTHLWEQKPGNAEMLSGYQGSSKAPNFRLWLSSIDRYQTEPTVN